jgi:hypothetical protein
VRKQRVERKAPVKAGVGRLDRYDALSRKASLAEDILIDVAARAAVRVQPPCMAKILAKSERLAANRSTPIFGAMTPLP